MQKKNFTKSYKSENAQLFDFGLFDQDKKDRTGFQIAIERGRIDVINLIKEKLPRNFWDYQGNIGVYQGDIPEHWGTLK